MAYIPIYKVVISPTPPSFSAITVAYKLASDPDVPGSYTIVTTDLIANPDGTLVGGTYNITGLADNTEYTVHAYTYCGGVKENFTSLPEIQQVQVNYDFSEVGFGQAVFAHATGLTTGEESGYFSYNTPTTGTFYMPDNEYLRTFISPDISSPNGLPSTLRLRVINTTTNTVFFDQTGSGSQIKTPQIATAPGNVYSIIAEAVYTPPVTVKWVMNVGPDVSVAFLTLYDPVNGLQYFQQTFTETGTFTGTISAPAGRYLVLTGDSHEFVMVYVDIFDETDGVYMSTNNDEGQSTAGDTIMQIGHVYRATMTVANLSPYTSTTTTLVPPTTTTTTTTTTSTSTSTSTTTSTTTTQPCPVIYNMILDSNF